MTFALSLACAFIAALCYGIGSVMQAAAARRAEMRPNLDPMLLVRLAGDLSYVASLGLDLLGFVASVVALRTLPLFMVQSAIAGSVGVTAFAASIAFGVRLERYEHAALVALLVGFALLALSARPGHSETLGAAGHWLLGSGVVLVAAIGALERTGRRARRRHRARARPRAWASPAPALPPVSSRCRTSRGTS